MFVRSAEVRREEGAVLGERTGRASVFFRSSKTNTAGRIWHFRSGEEERGRDVRSQSWVVMVWTPGPKV